VTANGRFTPRVNALLYDVDVGAIYSYLLCPSSVQPGERLRQTDI